MSESEQLNAFIQQLAYTFGQLYLGDITLLPEQSAKTELETDIELRVDDIKLLNKLLDTNLTYHNDPAMSELQQGFVVDNHEDYASFFDNLFLEELAHSTWACVVSERQDLNRYRINTDHYIGLSIKFLSANHNATAKYHLYFRFFTRKVNDTENTQHFLRELKEGWNFFWSKNLN